MAGVLEEALLRLSMVACSVPDPAFIRFAREANSGGCNSLRQYPTQSHSAPVADDNEKSQGSARHA